MSVASTALARAYLTEHPIEAGRAIETLSEEAILGYLAALPPEAVPPVMNGMTPTIAGPLLAELSAEARQAVLGQADRTRAAVLLGQLPKEEQDALLAELPDALSGQIRKTLSYPEATAGRLLSALKDEASLDIQTMVGASRDERALSSSWFALRKRMPWLQINLLTAFLAASVVGLFEQTIATYTALAILLPVVAGQSGNAGAQALAVTMRGLALREITIGH